jgi:hypothetical protein
VIDCVTTMNNGTPDCILHVGIAKDTADPQHHEQKKISPLTMRELPPCGEKDY